MYFGYARVSSKDQNPKRQLEALRESQPLLKEVDIYVDMESGKDFYRPNYQEMRRKLREGDVLIISELDRLGRNKQAVKEELEHFAKSGIQVKILNIPTTLIELKSDQKWILDMINNILVEVLAAIAEEERNKIRIRQAEGIEIAKREGKYKGRKPKELPKDFERLYKRWKNENITAVEFTKLMGYKSRTSLYRVIKQYEKDRSRYERET